jgi:hypothetical protein
MTSSAETQPGAAARWRRIDGDDRASFDQACTETINLLQWPARIANSFVTAAEPEERFLLEFRAADTAFVTQRFDRDIALELRLPSLELQFLEHDRPTPHVLDPEEHSPAEVEAWLLVELLHRGLDRGRFSTRLPYDIPGLLSGDAVDYSPRACRPGLMRLATWLRDGATVLAAAVGSGTARIVCRPSALDLICVSSRDGAPILGFSPGSAIRSEPFFSVRAADGRESAFLTASQLARESDPAAAAASFIKAAVDRLRPA